MDNIEVGDLVECVKISYKPNNCPIVIGGIYLVNEIMIGHKNSRSGEVPCVCLENIHPFYDLINGIVYNGTRMSDFKKINPDSTKKAIKQWDWNKQPVEVE